MYRRAFKFGPLFASSRQSESNYSFFYGLFYLQIFHHYEIQFSFKDSLGEDLSSDPLQNLHVKVMDVKPTEDGTYTHGFKPCSHVPTLKFGLQFGPSWQPIEMYTIS